MIIRLALAVALVAIAGSAQAAELRLSFPELKPGGQVTYAVFDTKAAWDSRGAARIGGSLTSGRSEVRIDLPPGAYAVMAYHDRNSNGRLDTLPVGLPTEPYGFSNNSRAMFGPPSWSAARFRLDAPGTVQTIRLR